MENILSKLVLRLKQIGIEIEMISNYPWIYLDKVNGNKIQEEDYFCGNHGFTIAFYQIKQEIKLTDISKIFKIIRKYK